MQDRPNTNSRAGRHRTIRPTLPRRGAGKHRQPTSPRVLTLASALRAVVAR